MHSWIIGKQSMYCGMHCLKEFPKRIRIKNFPYPDAYILSLSSLKNFFLHKTMRRILSKDSIQGVPEKMFLSEIGALLIKEHFLGTPGT